MRQNRFLLWLRPRPRWGATAHQVGAYSPHSCTLAGFNGPWGGKGKVWKGMGRKGKDGLSPQKLYLALSLISIVHRFHDTSASYIAKGLER